MRLVTQVEVGVRLKQTGQEFEISRAQRAIESIDPTATSPSHDVIDRFFFRFFLGALLVLFRFLGVRVHVLGDAPSRSSLTLASLSAAPWPPRAPYRRSRPRPSPSLAYASIRSVRYLTGCKRFAMSRIAFPDVFILVRGAR